MIECRCPNSFQLVPKFYTLQRPATSECVLFDDPHACQFDSSERSAYPECVVFNYFHTIVHLYQHQASTSQECTPSNNFDGFVDADMSDMSRHFLIAAHVNKHIIITAFFSHDGLRSKPSGCQRQSDKQQCKSESNVESGQRSSFAFLLAELNHDSS